MTLGVVIQVVCDTAGGAGAVGGVELAEPGRARFAELRVERHTGEPGLVGKHRVVEPDVLRADVEKRHRPRAVLVGHIEQAPQVVYDEPTGPVADGHQELDARVGGVGLSSVARVRCPWKPDELVGADDQVTLLDLLRDRVVERLRLGTGRAHRGEKGHG